MSIKEMQREVEYAECLASQLSAHATLFDGYYDCQYGLEQAQLDPDCYFTAWNMLFEKVDELYGFLKQTVAKMYEKEEA